MSESQATNTPAAEPASTDSAAQNTQSTPPGEVPATEPAAPAEQVQDTKFASKFAALARKERELSARSKEFKALESEVREWQKAKASAKENPLAYLKYAGIDPDTIIDGVLKGGGDAEPDPVAKVQKELEEIKARDAERVELENRRQLEQRVQIFKSEQKKFIESHADRYELIQTFDASDLVFQVTDEYYRLKGEVPTHEQAANLVERHLEKTLEKLPSVKKAQKYFAPKEPAQPKDTAPEKTQTTKTITNTMAQDVATPDQGSRPLSRQESVERAARLIRWT